MNRREFFTKGWAQAAANARKPREVRVARPPFALAEADFLGKCTSCCDCVSACPHDVIFQLGASHGIGLKGTPALDLLNKGCHLCDGWPCVAACEAGALVIEPPKDSEGLAEAAPPLPTLALARLEVETCIAYKGPECGACSDICPIDGALTWDGPKPVINADKCVGCALCRAACITEPKAIGIVLHDAAG